MATVLAVWARIPVSVAAVPAGVAVSAVGYEPKPLESTSNDSIAAGNPLAALGTVSSF